VTSESKSWPLLDERAPFATASRSRRRGKTPRSAWLLAGLAFLCGGLVSAAAFSIGWRHQAQRNTAAQSALAAARARTHELVQRISTLQTTLGEARGAASSAHAAAAAAAASEKALARAGASVAEEADVSHGNGSAISSSADALAAAATRVAGELKTLDTYLTTTPTSQLDPGYIASQTAYLAQRLSRLQEDGGTLGTSARSFETTLRKLGRDARALKETR
jgi:cytoskeletal protein RodZ